MFVGFGLKVVFDVAIALKNKTQKQIEDKSADRGDPNSTIQSLCTTTTLGDEIAL